MKRFLLLLPVLLLALVLTKSDVPAQSADSSKVVKVEIAKDPTSTNQEKVFVITLTVELGYHLYANPVINPDLASVQTSVAVKSEGTSIPSKVEYPAGKLVKDDVVGDYATYEGVTKIKAKVVVPNDQKTPLEVVVKYQACSKKSCLAPAVATFKLP